MFSRLLTLVPRLFLFTLYFTEGLAIFGAAATPLPALAGFYGSYEIVDSGPQVCSRANNMSGGCSCPGNIAASYQFKVLNDAAGSGTQQAAELAFCISGKHPADAVFAGAYQQDDPAPGRESCRASNHLTGTCSCPTASALVRVRSLVSGPRGVQGSTIGLCLNPHQKPTSFGGAYEHDDPVPGNLGCRANNPFTGACSCPAGMAPQAHRLEVDTPGGFIGTNLFTCVARPPKVEICPGFFADPAGTTPASASIQFCIDATQAGGTLAIPAGNYLLDAQITITKPLTLRTRGTSATAKSCLGSTPCATLVAAPTLFAAGGMLMIKTSTHVAIDHIVLDGNRFTRINDNPAYRKCLEGINIYGFNATVSNCADCSWTNSASISALCGTGLQWIGDRALLANNTFSGNGDYAIHGAYSDGLTLLHSDGATVMNNKFIDNSDVSLIFGGGKNAKIHDNLISQRGMRAFAGFMLDNFNGTTSGDFIGTVIARNRIDCAPDMCFFGVNIGPHPWYGSANLKGGMVSNNTIIGGAVSLNVDGAGTPNNPTILSGNDLGPPRPALPAHCGPSAAKSILTARFSANRDSVIKADVAPDLWQEVHGCNGS